MTNKEREELIISLMIDLQNRADELADHYGELFEAEMNKLVSLLSIHGGFWQYTPEGQRAVGAIKTRLEAIKTAYTEEAEEALIMAYEEIDERLGRSYDEEGTFNEAKSMALQMASEAVAQMSLTYSMRVSELVILMQILPAMEDPKATLGKIGHLGKQLRSFMRKNFKTQLSTLVNTVLYNSFSANGVKKVLWETRPEATESGTCKECLGYASGGINRDGIYTLEDVPAIPAHDHCACVLIPQ